MFKKNLTAAVACLGLAVGSALAVPNPPGYTWGIANCGPANTTSAGACHICCAGGQRNGSINSTERDGCDQLCDDANFTRMTFWSSFWGNFRPFHYQW